MSTVVKCPTCGSNAKIKEKEANITYHVVQNEEAFKKIGQLKKVMEKFKAKAEQLEKELETLRAE